MKKIMNTFAIRYTGIGAAILFTLAAGTVYAQPQTPSASASSYGAMSSGTYIYGPLSDSSTGTPATAQVSQGYSCGGTVCLSNGAATAVGSAHANAGGDAGAYASITAPNGSATAPYTSYLTDAVVGDSQASFSNSAIVRSALDPITGQPIYADGTPTQISVSLLFDGFTNLGAGDLQTASASNGGFTASGNVSANFALTDPSITGTGESAGIPTDLISFQANVNSTDSSLYDNTKGHYVPEQSASTSWTLTSNHGDNLGTSTSYDCDGKVSDCGSYVINPSTSGTGFTIPAGSLGTDFTTGIQTVTLDTTIGATLNWDASMYVFNQAYGATAFSESDFSHTLGVNLNPTTSDVTLAFSQAQVPLSTVPLPASLWLYLSGISALALVARRKRSTGAPFSRSPAT